MVRFRDLKDSINNLGLVVGFMVLVLLVLYHNIKQELGEIKGRLFYLEDIVHKLETEELLNQDQKSEPVNPNSPLENQGEILSRYFPYKYEAREDVLNCNQVELTNPNAQYQLDCQVQEDGTIRHLSQTTVRVESATIRSYLMNAYRIEKEISSVLAKQTFRFDIGFHIGLYVEGLFEYVPGFAGSTNCSAEVYFALNSKQPKFPGDVMSYLKEPGQLDDLVTEVLKNGCFLNVRDTRCSSDGQVVYDNDWSTIRTGDIYYWKYEKLDDKPGLLGSLIDYMMLRAPEKMESASQGEARSDL